MNNNYTDATVKIDKAQFSLYELKRRCEVTERIILNPDFQRGDAWKTDRQKSELLESVLMSIPIPLFYFFEDKLGRMEVVDGRQRITTFIEFFNNEFPLTFLSNLSNLNTLYFKDLPLRLQAKIEDYQITAYVIQPPTPERIKYDIFDRVNRAGTRLNAQEIRNALNQGLVTELLNELSILEIFRLATDNRLNSDRMEDKEWILRFLYVYLLKIERFKFDYPYDLAECLTDTMKYLNRKEDLTYLKESFIEAMKLSYELFKEDGFKFSSSDELNVNLFEVLSYLYVIVDKDKNMDNLKEQIEDLKDEFQEMTEFNSFDLKENKFKFDRVEDLKENDNSDEDTNIENREVNIEKLNFRKIIEDLKGEDD